MGDAKGTGPGPGTRMEGKIFGLQGTMNPTVLITGLDNSVIADGEKEGHSC